MAFSSRTGKNQQGEMAEINIVPFVDVMLVLLVIFMVTAPLMQESIDVDLPAVSTASANMESKDKVITINQQGQVFVEGDDKTTYTLEDLAPRLESLFADDPGTEKTLFLRADKNVAYGTVVEIMSLAKEVGITRIGMITEPDVDKKGS